MNLAFRLASVADTDLLAEFMREFYALDHLAFDEQAAQFSLQQILSSESLGLVWLIQIDGSPIGYVVLTLGFSLEFHGRDAFIDEIYIRTTHRGKGIGTRALEFVEVACRPLGVRAIHLEVGRNNAKAHAVYHKIGFEYQDSYLMTKCVGS